MEGNNNFNNNEDLEVSFNNMNTEIPASSSDFVPNIEPEFNMNIPPTFETPTADMTPSFDTSSMDLTPTPAPIMDTPTTTVETPVPTMEAPVADDQIPTSETLVSDPASPGNQRANWMNQHDSSTTDSATTAQAPIVPKKKKGTVKKVICCILLVLIVACGTLWALVKFNATAANTFYSTVLKPQQYYQMMEGKYIGSLFSNEDKSGIKLSTLTNSAKHPCKTTSTITLSESLTALAGSLGQYGTLIQSIKSISFNTDSFVKGSDSSSQIELILNDNSIITVDVIIDTASSSIYLQCPTVLKRWIRIPVEGLDENTFDLTSDKEIDPKDMQTILEKYLKIIFNSMTDVKLSKNMTTTIQESKVEGSQIDIDVKTSDIVTILTNLNTELQKDDLVYKYVKMFSEKTTKDEYKKAIASVLDPKEDESLTKNVSTEKISFIMSVFLDKQGNIISRKFTKDKNVISIDNYDSGDVTKYGFAINAEGLKFNISGSSKTNGDAVTGSTNIELEATDTMVDSATSAVTSKATTLTDVEPEQKYDSAKTDTEDSTSASAQSYKAQMATNTTSQTSTATDDSASITTGDTAATTDGTATKSDENDATSSDDITSDVEEDITSSNNVSFGLVIDYKDLKTVNEEKGLISGSYTITPKNIKNASGASIVLNFGVKDNYQTSDIIVNYSNQELVKFGFVNSASQIKDVTVPEASLEYESTFSNPVALYNILLEIDTYTPVKALMTAMNNKIFNVMVKQFYTSKGYHLLNGKQTAAHLKNVALLNPNTIKPIFLAGYMATKQGKNPGLDALSKGSTDTSTDKKPTDGTGENANADANTNTDANANTNANANVGANANTDTNANANANANTDTNANADANANTNANANTGATTP